MKAGWTENTAGAGKEGAKSEEGKEVEVKEAVGLAEDRERADTEEMGKEEGSLGTAWMGKEGLGMVEVGLVAGREEEDRRVGGLEGSNL